jgi:predicted lipoprotein
LGVFGALLASGGCRRLRSRDSILAALVAEVVAPDLLEVERRSADLVRAAQRLQAAPAEPELLALRACWRRAALAWKRAAAFRGGPWWSGEALLRATYWPARSSAIRELLRAERSPGAALLAELGADVKGLYALEYLLFDQDGEPAAWQRLSGSSGVRARELVFAYAEDLCARAADARAALRRAAPSAAATTALSGPEGLAKVVALLAENIEGSLVARLQVWLWLSSLQRLRTVDIEGGASRSSPALMQAVLLGSQRLYLGGAGGGLADLVERAAPAVHLRVANAFEAANGAFRGLPAPLESAAPVERTRVELALRATKALETALKTELPSALGVTLTFSSIDAD